MAVLQVTSGLIHLGGNPAKETNALRIDTAKVPYGFRVNENASAGMQYQNEAPAGDTVYYQFSYFMTNGNGSSEDGYMWTINDGAGSKLFAVELSNALMTVQAYGDTTVNTATGATLGATTLQDMKIRITVNASEVTAEMFSNGVSIGTATAANTGGKGVARQMVLNNYDAIYAGSISFSSFMVSDTDLSNFGYTKLSPSAAGTDTDFGGDTFAELADDSDASGISSTTIGAKSSFPLTTYSGGSAVYSYVVSAVVASGVGSSGSFRFYLLIGGVRYNGAAQTIADSETKLAQQEWALDPSDSTPWTTAKINATEVGIEILP